MRDIVIKGKWRWLFLLFITFSVGFNLTFISLHFTFVSMPIPDAEVTKAFNDASPEVVTSKVFTHKLQNRYFVLIETTKEGKDMLEKLEKKN